MNEGAANEKRPVPAACPCCHRSIDDVFDLPLVEVVTVTEVEPPERAIESWMGERDVHDSFVATAASPPVRKYLDDLRALSGRRVAPNALRAPWRDPAAKSGFFVVPGSSRPRGTHPPWWALVWGTHWHGERLRATVEVLLATGGANFGSAGGAVVIPVAPIARVEVEGTIEGRDH